jgi:FKBP-type peptidyl-prolyl cis-trans isomerase FkpA
MRYLFIAIIAFVIQSCGDTYSTEDKTTFDKQIETYLTEKGIKCERSTSGLYYKIIEKGEGRNVIYKDRVSFNYTGEFLDGTVFDEQKEPVKFQVRQLIGAWKEIMLELKKGSTVFLVAPPFLGYGAHELEAIPPHSILVFNMEVTDIN